MAKSRRRNKRNANKIVETISNETFKKIVLVIGIIMILCVGIMGVRYWQDQQKLAEQRQKLDKQIESIFQAETQQEETQEEEDTVIHMAVVGDILCGNLMLEDAKTGEDYQFTSMLEGVKEYTEAADIAIGTMETNFTQNEYSGNQEYNSPVSFAQAVKDVGIDVVSTSHNHSLDYGLDGLKQTKQNLEEIGYTIVGTKESVEEKNYIIQEVSGIKIAFLAYTYGFNNENSITEEEKQYVNVFSLEQATQDIQAAKEEGAEYICVIMHWGEVNATRASEEQKQIADSLVKNGANIIVGSHPSVVQQMEMKKNAEGEDCFVAYSLGNYISSLSSENANLEIILDIQLRKDAQTGKVILEKVNYTPIYVLDNGKDAENRYTLVDMQETARKYASGETTEITRQTYDKLMEGLEKLEEIIRRQS